MQLFIFALGEKVVDAVEDAERLPHVLRVFDLFVRDAVESARHMHFGGQLGVRHYCHAAVSEVCGTCGVISGTLSTSHL